MAELNGVDFSRLPQPILPCRPAWLELYDFSWKTAAKNIRSLHRTPCGNPTVRRPLHKA